MVSLFLIAIGAAFFIPIVKTYLETGLVDRYPTLIVVTSLWVIAIISYFSGVILQVLKKQHRHNFERYLNMLEEINKQLENR
jgi:cbb3-type cytochrome oxidase subunit 3